MRHRLTVLLVLAMFLLQFSGCHNREQLKLPPDEPLQTNDSIVGLTTKDGREVLFDEPALVVDEHVVGVVESETVTFALVDVERLLLERRTLNEGKTVLAVIGIGVGVVAAWIGIALATKESCPFVYSWDGERYVFDAEPYGGAISRGLERDDWAELEHLQPDQGRYRLLVRNEVPETQHTNLMELWVVDHEPGIRVLADQQGGLHTLVDPSPPISARDQLGRDLRVWLSASDQLIWEPRPAVDERGGVRDEIILEFRKPADAQRVKLLARVATGLWGSHMIRQFLTLRGGQLEAWYASIDNDPESAREVHAWSQREELYGLKLAIDEDGTWVDRGLLLGGGPFISEERVVMLDVSRVRGERLRLRLRPPRGFWALDSFAIDATEDRPIELTRLLPLEARDAAGRDLLPSLSQIDDSYHTLPRIGDSAELSFAAPPPLAGLERTVLLHSRGWYRLHLDGRGEPQRALLREIEQQPDAAARLAAELYAQRGAP